MERACSRAPGAAEEPRPTGVTIGGGDGAGIKTGEAATAERTGGSGAFGSSANKLGASASGDGSDAGVVFS